MDLGGRCRVRAETEVPDFDVSPMGPQGMGGDEFSSFVGPLQMPSDELDIDFGGEFEPPPNVGSTGGTAAGIMLSPAGDIAAGIILPASAIAGGIIGHTPGCTSNIPVPASARRRRSAISALLKPSIPFSASFKNGESASAP